VLHLAAPGPGLRGRGGTTEGRVLVVDDDEPIARMMAEFLAEHGFEADWAAAAAPALVKIKAEPPDAIVLDLRMPDMDGRALLAAVRTSGLARASSFLRDREVAPRGAGAGLRGFFGETVRTGVAAGAVRARWRRCSRCENSRCETEIPQTLRHGASC